MISVCMLTIDRYMITKRALENNLKPLIEDNIPFELLVCDNGSKDQEIINYIASLKPAYHRLNKRNEGVGRGFNQLMIRAKGDYICLVGNDILYPAGWPQMCQMYAKMMGNKCGLIGFDWGIGKPPLSSYNLVTAHFLDEKIDKVFGNWFFPRNLLNVVGGFCEEFYPYGLEDSDFNNRVNLSGLKSFYIPYSSSMHIGWDVGENSEYRLMKDKSLGDNLPILQRRCEEYKTKGFFEPLPPLRDPLT